MARILLVEDFVINQKVAKAILKTLGYEQVSIANNGIEALQAFKQDSYDLILMDYQMPEMDGYCATQEIRKIQTKHIPIIAMTADVLMGDCNRWLSAGMDDYIAKPIDKIQLEKILMYWLEEKPAHSSRSKVKKIIAHKPEQQVLDHERLTQVFGDNTAAKHHFLQTFSNTASTLLQDIMLDIKNKNKQSAQQHCHTLKGSCGNAGINKMYELAKELESNVTNEDWIQAQKLAKAEEEALNEVIEISLNLTP
jgi:two-component system sensor histidine kinase/response regulator